MKRATKGKGLLLLLVSLMMVFTMMPSAAMLAFADDEATEQIQVDEREGVVLGDEVEAAEEAVAPLSIEPEALEPQANITHNDDFSQLVGYNAGVLTIDATKSVKLDGATDTDIYNLPGQVDAGTNFLDYLSGASIDPATVTGIVVNANGGDALNKNALFYAGVVAFVKDSANAAAPTLTLNLSASLNYASLERLTEGSPMEDGFAASGLNIFATPTINILGRGVLGLSDYDPDTFALPTGFAVKVTEGGATLELNPAAVTALTGKFAAGELAGPFDNDKRVVIRLTDSVSNVATALENLGLSLAGDPGVVVTGVGTGSAVAPKLFYVYKQNGQTGEKTIAKVYTKDQFLALSTFNPYAYLATNNHGAGARVYATTRSVLVDDLLADAGLPELQPGYRLYAEATDSYAPVVFDAEDIIDMRYFPSATTEDGPGTSPDDAGVSAPAAIGINWGNANISDYGVAGTQRNGTYQAALAGAYDSGNWRIFTGCTVVGYAESGSALHNQISTNRWSQYVMAITLVTPAFTVYTQDGDDGEPQIVKAYNAGQFEELVAEDNYSFMNYGSRALPDVWEVHTTDGFIPLNDLLTDAGLTMTPYDAIRAQASFDGFGNTLSYDAIDQGKYFFPATTPNEVNPAGKVETPAGIALNWKGNPLTTGTASGAATANETAFAGGYVDPNHQYRFYVGLSEEDFAAKNAAGRRFPTGPDQLILIRGEVPAAPIEVIRHDGANRLETAVLASQKAFPVPAEVDTAIVAFAGNFPDALAAASLAGAAKAPILLTNSATVDQIVLDELTRLAPAKVYVLGSNSVVSDTALSQIESLSFTPAVTRLGGVDRYETARLIAEEAVTLGSSTDTILLATGENYADALSVGSIAAGKKITLLLTPSGSLSPRVSQFIADNEVKNVIVIGGPPAVANSVIGALVTEGVGVQRLSGDTRYETANKAALSLMQRYGITPTLVGIATGENFPDALAASAAIGLRGGILVITPTNTLHAASANTLTAIKGNHPTVEILGSAVAVSQTVQDAVVDLLSPPVIAMPEA
jgi:putative cell wall-binding protein